MPFTASVIPLHSVHNIVYIASHNITNTIAPPIFIRQRRIKRLAAQPSLSISQLYQNLTRIAFYFFSISYLPP
jgi:hypothetical protein